MYASFDGSFAITNTGAMRFGDLHQYGRAFKIAFFQAGSAGHDKATNLPLSVNPTLTNLPSPTTALIPFSAGQITQIDFKKTLVQPVFNAGVGTGVLSSIGIYGQVFAVVDPADTALVGNVFLYAVANIGYNSKASNSTRTFNLILNSI